MHTQRSTQNATPAAPQYRINSIAGVLRLPRVHAQGARPNTAPARGPGDLRYDQPTVTPPRPWPRFRDVMAEPARRDRQRLILPAGAHTAAIPPTWGTRGSQRAPPGASAHRTSRAPTVSARAGQPGSAHSSAPIHSPAPRPLRAPHITRSPARAHGAPAAMHPAASLLDSPATGYS